MLFMIIMGKVIFIRCTDPLVDTRAKFRVFCGKYDFPDYEAALLELLRLAEAHPDNVREKGIRYL